MENTKRSDSDTNVIQHPGRTTASRMGRVEVTGRGIERREMFSEEEIELLRRQNQEVTDDEFEFFIKQCKRTRLDPFARQIYLIQRWDSRKGRKVGQVQVSIDGLRLIAERTGKYAGQRGPFWYDQNGSVHEVWLDESAPPAAAKVGVLRSDFDTPLWAVARWDAFVATNRQDDPVFMWKKMGPHMLGKCAEALGLRKAFPQETGGLYTEEEMAQAENEKRNHDAEAAYGEASYEVQNGTAAGTVNAARKEGGPAHNEAAPDRTHANGTPTNGAATNGATTNGSPARGRGDNEQQINGGGEKEQQDAGERSVLDARLKEMKKKLFSAEGEEFINHVETLADYLSTWPDSARKRAVEVVEDVADTRADVTRAYVAPFLKRIDPEEKSEPENDDDTPEGVNKEGRGKKKTASEETDPEENASEPTAEESTASEPTAEGDRADEPGQETKDDETSAAETNGENNTGVEGAQDEVADEGNPDEGNPDEGNPDEGDPEEGDPEEEDQRSGSEKMSSEADSSEAESSEQVSSDQDSPEQPSPEKP